jgi:hypothetical protein
MQTVTDPEVLEVLKSLSFDANKAFITTPNLPPKTYKKVDAVLQAHGGKWNRGQKCHLFAGDAKTAMGQFLSTGSYIDAKKDHAFFETPEHLVVDLVDMAMLSDGMTVLEPSAGKGAIVRELVVSKAEVFAVELNPAYERDLVAAGAKHVQIGDFLSMEIDRQFDRVVMNPPFSIDNKTVDTVHVLKAWGLVKPGGILLSIMSPGWTFRRRKDDLSFRKFVETHGFYKENELGDFKDSGTNIQTVTIVLDKP